MGRVGLSILRLDYTTFRNSEKNMRFLHTSDWHLGKSLGGRDMDADQRFALARIRDHLRDEAYDLLVIAGDMFDRATPSEEAVELLGEWLGEVRAFRPKLPIVIIAGNHDNGPRLAWTSSLLDYQGVYLRGSPDKVDSPIVVHGAAGVTAQVWAVPYLLPSAMSEAVPSQAGAMQEAINRISARQDRSMAQVLVAHCFVANGLTSDSERSLVGTATQIDPTVFAGFDYVALGHLHRPQSVAENARYSGSIARYSFSEAGHSKAMLDVTVAPGVQHVCVSHPLPTLRPMRRITDTLEALRTDPKYDDQLDAYVELTLNPPVDVGNPLDVLHQRWPHIRSFRNELVSPVAALSTVRDVTGEGPRDLLVDFLDFDKQFAASDTPPEAVLAAFHTLLARLPEEVTA